MNFKLIAIFHVLLPLTALAQKNIIDVPTSDIVKKNKVFYQYQGNIGDRKIKNSLVLTGGLGKNWEAGITINQLTFNLRPSTMPLEMNHNIPEENPDLLINLQKAFTYKDFYMLGIGTKSGLGLATKAEELEFTTYNYINNSFCLPGKPDKLILGAYYANLPYTGQGTALGYHIGVEKSIVRDQLEFFVEYISGNSSISVINIGLQYNLPKDWSVDLGAQLPAPGSGNSPGILIQLARN